METVRVLSNGTDNNDIEWPCSRFCSFAV